MAHDLLEKALGRIQEKGLTINKEKCKFHMSGIEFMGRLLSARGIGPTQSKIGSRSAQLLGSCKLLCQVYPRSGYSV